MTEFLISRIKAFRNAFTGWWYVIRTQRNAWIHTVVTIGVLVVGLWLKLEGRDWALIVVAVAMVWAAEFANTALEAVVDLASPEKHPLAKVGKDVGAAAVLIAAGAAILIGLLVMGPPLWDRLRGIVDF